MRVGVSPAREIIAFYYCYLAANSWTLSSYFWSLHRKTAPASNLSSTSLCDVLRGHVRKEVAVTGRWETLWAHGGFSSVLSLGLEERGLVKQMEGGCLYSDEINKGDDRNNKLVE
jgi:hypothetical protein